MALGSREVGALPNEDYFVLIVDELSEVVAGEVDDGGHRSTRS
jgi:hypothetical protein